jgi:hypothetical protein
MERNVSMIWRLPESLQESLRSQLVQRGLPVFYLVFLLAIALAACSGAADTAAPAGPETAAEAEPAAPPQFTITFDADEISVPDGIPAGLVAITVDNADTEWHSAIIRRLNEGVSLEDFAAAFEEEPRSTFPMTSFVGGPDVPGETAIPGYYSLTAGTYVLVDNWVEPWRFTSFQVGGETVQAEPPEAGVNVLMNEYAIDLPESLPGGSHLWQFTNEGEFLHNVGIIRLAEGQSVDDLVAWMNEQQGPPPFEYFGMWNIVSPGVTSWGELELQPGDYLAVDMMPDFASEGGWNVEQGMFQAFTVSS